MTILNLREKNILETIIFAYQITFFYFLKTSFNTDQDIVFVETVALSAVSILPTTEKYGWEITNVILY